MGRVESEEGSQPRELEESSQATEGEDDGKRWSRATDFSFSRSAGTPNGRGMLIYKMRGKGLAYCFRVWPRGDASSRRSERTCRLLAFDFIPLDAGASVFSPEAVPLVEEVSSLDLGSTGGVAGPGGERACARSERDGQGVETEGGCTIVSYAL
jgi:hypothetical protein